LNLPFVGAGVLSSAVAMDKDVMKRLFRDAGIPISKFLVFERFEQKKISFSKVKQQLGVPVFVKPANMGSSVGISKVKTPAEFKKAVQTAFKYDSKIVIEQNIIGREIECSVLGNSKPIASLPGEIIAHKDFYSYDAKYIDDQGASLKIPATLPKTIVKQVQVMAIKAYKALNCEGMGRVDMFLTRQNKILVNEINTIPGFTPAISMYPKLWAASGLATPKLLDRLIELAFERHREEKKNK
jgi:D-alanine-D-alanine ligase